MDKWFPPPPGKFPPPNAPFPPPAAAAEAGKAKKVRKPATKKQKLITFGAVGFIVLLALGWAVSRVLSANAAPPVVEHKPVPKKAPVKPAATAEKPAENPAEKPAEATPATAVAETPAPAGTKAPESKPVETKPAEAKPAETTPATATPAPTQTAPVAAVTAPPAPVAPPPPPPASLQFKAGVEALKISGVRGGSSPRIFIGGTSYQVGDLVNPQLGITFEGYNSHTRSIIFKDKTGAIVERRN